MTVRLYLFLFLLLFFGFTFFFRSYLLWKNTGIYPITFDESDDAHGFNGKIFKIVILSTVVVTSICAFGGSWSEYLLPFWYLEMAYLKTFGWISLHGSLIWIFIAQVQMADSWRIGIDTQHKTELISKGLFSISRNPIFLGILIANLGLFLILPNAFTLLIAVISFTSIQTQARLEEVFLRATQGENYINYCKRVNRWI